jgi:recombination protein RecA
MVMSVKSKLQEIANRYGEEMHANLAEEPEEVEVIPSGVLSLDSAMSIPLATCNGKPVLGGYARGRLTEMYGAEAGGKTSLALAHLAEVSRIGGTGIYIDVENKASAYYFKRIFEEQEADPSNIEIVRPPHAEAVWEIVKNVGSEVDSIVIDSLADMITKARLDADIGEQQPGMLARVTQDGLKKSKIWETDCVLLLINQIREKIGGYSHYNQTTPGGHSRKHKAVMRIKIRRTGTEKEGSKEVGITVEAYIRKNQLGAPHGRAGFRLYWGRGVDKRGDLIGTALDVGLLIHTGNGYYYLPYDNAANMTEENKLYKRENVRPTFDKHPEMYDQLEEKLAQLVQTGAID